MKQILFGFILLFLSFPMLAQERRLEQVDDRLFSYREYNNGKVVQSGYYEKHNGEFIATGVWKNSLGTTAYFKDGEMLWIRFKGEERVSKEQIEIHRLKRKVARLEQALTSL
jgi:hypothetical protein